MSGTVALQIYLLGKLQVLRDGNVISPEAFVTKKAILLLKILLTAYPHPVTKDQLLEWLWPDVEPEVGAKSLRAVTSRLRRALEPDLPRYASSSFIQVSGGRYRFQPGSNTWLDVAQFEAVVAEGKEQAQQSQKPVTARAYREARQLYRGDYLEEDRYEDWAMAERERLREMYLDITGRLADIFAQQGRYRRAIALCREVLAADGLRESVWRQLMRYHFYAGDPALALRAYKKCKQALAQELAVEPDPETTALYQEIQQYRQINISAEVGDLSTLDVERSQNLPLILGRMPFVGRRKELTWLLDQLNLATIKRSRLVLIEGEAGIGKTRLAEEVLAYACQQNVTVLIGQCREQFRNQPYWPIREVLAEIIFTSEPQLADLDAGWLAASAELWPNIRKIYPNLPALPSLSPQQEKLRLFESLAQLILTLKTATGMVLFIDDLHWADRAMLEFLNYFLTQPDTKQILVLGAIRSEEVMTVGDERDLTRFLWQLKDQEKLQRLTLSLLSWPAVEALFQELSGLSKMETQLGQLLFEETAGHPLFLQATLQSMFETGWLVVNQNGRWDLLEPTILNDLAAHTPTTVQRVIEERLQQVGLDTQQVLEAAAVLGRTFGWSTLRHMRRWRWDVLYDHLDHLIEGMIIQEQPDDHYLFSHDKIHQVAYENIPDERRRWLHRKAGEALEIDAAEQTEEMAGILAYHFYQARVYNKAFDYRLQAGRYAGSIYANAEAMENYKAALALVDQHGFQPTTDLLTELHKQLANLYEAAGHYSEAMAQVEVALQHVTRPDVRVRLQYKLVHYRDRLGTAHRRELLQQLVWEVNRLGAGQVGYLEAARVYSRWAILGSGEGEAEESARYVHLAEEALRAYLPAMFDEQTRLTWDEYDATHTVLINAGEALLFWGHLAEAMALLQQSLILAERQNDVDGRGFSNLNIGDVLAAQGNFVEARTWYQRAISDWETSGQKWTQMLAYAQNGLTWVAEQAWSEAMISFQCALAIGEEIDPTEWLAKIYLLLTLTEAKLTTNIKQAQVYLQQAEAAAKAADQRMPPLLWHLAQSAATQSHADWQVARRLFAEFTAAGRVGVEWEIFIPWFAPQFEPPKEIGDSLTNL